MFDSQTQFHCLPSCCSWYMLFPASSVFALWWMYQHKVGVLDVLMDFLGIPGRSFSFSFGVTFFKYHCQVSASFTIMHSTCVAESEKFWCATALSNLADRMEDYSIAHSAVVQVYAHHLDYTVACQNCSLLSTAHDCETGLWRPLPRHTHTHYFNISVSLSFTRSLSVESYSCQ